MKKVIALSLFYGPPAFAHAPSFNILGSYFPAWIVCILVSILLAAVVRFFVRRTNHGDLFEPGIITYPCLALFFSCTIWLFLFS